MQKESRIKKYMHKQHINTLANLPENCTVLIKTFEKQTGMSRENAKYFLDKEAKERAERMAEREKKESNFKVLEQLDVEALEDFAKEEATDASSMDDLIKANE